MRRVKLIIGALAISYVGEVFVIGGKAGSVAEEYALENNFIFEIVE